jgi:hypothetical protein
MSEILAGSYEHRPTKIQRTSNTINAKKQEERDVRSQNGYSALAIVIVHHPRQHYYYYYYLYNTSTSICIFSNNKKEEK